MKRIISFLPSATEIIYNIGADSQLVGVTHECTYPEEAKSKPQIIKSSFDPSILSSKEINDKINQIYTNKKDLFVFNKKNLISSKPDIIIAQKLCDVCAPFTKEISEAISILGYEPEVINLDPHNIEEIISSIYEIGKNVDKIDESKQLILSLQNRIKNIIKKSEKVQNQNNIKLKILCLEWLDPFFTAGHWVPEMIKIIGENNGLSSTGERSRRTDINEIEEFDPDKIILMPCGFDTNRTKIEYEKTLKGNERWNSLEAVKRKQVYVVNANAYFSKPSPRIVTGIEILSKIIHPNFNKEIKVPDDSYIKIY
ncbi:MAG: cobalamin-binding protein [Nitrososphaeraceae archaeon]